AVFKACSQPRYLWSEAIVWKLLVQPSSGHQRTQKVLKFAEGFLPFRPKSIQRSPHLLNGRNCARNKFTVVPTVRLRPLLRQKHSRTGRSAINRRPQKVAVLFRGDFEAPANLIEVRIRNTLRNWKGFGAFYQIVLSLFEPKAARLFADPS